VTEGLYERYKDALRRGHVAALRGRLDAALVAYGEAAVIAPERSLPHASLGSVHLRNGDPDAALAAFDAALHKTAHDEMALGGRADALTRLGRPAEAAGTLDLLATVLDEAGRVSEACDTARRALELAESKTRRRHVEALINRLRAHGRDQDAELVLARAMQFLELDSPAQARHQAAAHVPAGNEAGDSPAGIAEEAVPSPEPEPPADLETALALLASAEVAIDAGESEAARVDLLESAAVHARGGRMNAALDACYRGLALAPADADLHLALVGLFLDRGWRGPAADKLVLLGRLLDLSGDRAGRDRLCAVIAARFPDDTRLTALCA
jgi:tetratricopeptide (TPR) repeat protein